MRPIDDLVVHCSATPPKVDWGVAEIRRVHVQEKGYKDIGYHYVIRRSGRVEIGRPIEEVGSHVRGWNARSVGVCLVGGVDDQGRPENNFTPAQWTSLENLARELSRRFPNARWRGHRDFPAVAKACPCFDAISWAQKLGLPVARRKPAMASMLKRITIESEREDERDDDQIGDTSASGRKPLLQRRSFWRDATGVTGGGGIMALSYFNGFDPISLVILLAFASLWAGFFVWMFRKEIFG